MNNHNYKDQALLAICRLIIQLVEYNEDNEDDLNKVYECVDIMEMDDTPSFYRWRTDSQGVSK